MLTEIEKIILKNTGAKYRYVARDKSGDLYIYTGKPKRINILKVWSSHKCIISEIRVFNNLFKSVQWTDEEPLQFRDEKGKFLL